MCKVSETMVHQFCVHEVLFPFQVTFELKIKFKQLNGKFESILETETFVQLDSSTKIAHACALSIRKTDKHINTRIDMKNRNQLTLRRDKQTKAQAMIYIRN